MSFAEAHATAIADVSSVLTAIAKASSSSRSHADAHADSLSTAFAELHMLIMSLRDNGLNFTEIVNAINLSTAQIKIYVESIPPVNVDVTAIATACSFANATAYAALSASVAAHVTVEADAHTGRSSGVSPHRQQHELWVYTHAFQPILHCQSIAR